MIITRDAQARASAAIIELIKSLENPKSGGVKENAVDNALDALYVLDEMAWRKFMITKAKEAAHEVHSHDGKSD